MSVRLLDPHPSGIADHARAEPYTGATFGGWGGSCAGSGYFCTVRAFSDSDSQNISASFSQGPPPPPPTFPLTVTKQGTGFVGGGGIQCGSTCAASLGAGAKVQLVAVADPGSAFTGWGDACAGTAPCVLTVAVATSVSAAFTLLPAPGVVAVAGSGTRGGTAKLRYRVTTAEGDPHSEVVTVSRGRRTLAQLSHAPSKEATAFVLWRVPKSVSPGTAKFCVLATDVTSKRSAVACARLSIS